MPRLRRPSEKLAAKTSQFAGRGSAFLAAKWDQGIKTVKQPPVKTVLQGENGGKLDEHWYRFKALYASGAEVEIRGPCRSACTLITGAIFKRRLCFADDAHLAFQLVANGLWGWPRFARSEQWMLDRYPGRYSGLDRQSWRH
jgi:hypothetical protein